MDPLWPKWTASITAEGGISTAGTGSWRALITVWFKKTYPEAAISEINASISSHAVHNNTAPYYDRGETPPAVAAHQEAMDCYGLPSINVGRKMYDAIKAGRTVLSERNARSAGNRIRINARMSNPPEATTPIAAPRRAASRFHGSASSSLLTDGCSSADGGWEG